MNHGYKCSASFEVYFVFRTPLCLFWRKNQRSFLFEIKFKKKLRREFIQEKFYVWREVHRLQLHFRSIYEYLTILVNYINCVQKPLKCYQSPFSFDSILLRKYSKISNANQIKKKEMEQSDLAYINYLASLGMIGSVDDIKKVIGLLLKPKRAKRQYSHELNMYIQKLYEEQKMTFSSIAEIIGRKAKDVREHYLSYIIGKTHFSKEERDKLIELYPKYGDQYLAYVDYFPGATSVNVRDQINTLKRKNKLIKPPIISLDNESKGPDDNHEGLILEDILDCPSLLE